MSWQLKAIFKLLLCLWAEGRVNCFPPFSENEHLWIWVFLSCTQMCGFCATDRGGKCLLWCHWPTDTSLEPTVFEAAQPLIIFSWKNHKMRSLLLLNCVLCIIRVCLSFCLFLTAFSFTLKCCVACCARVLFPSSVPGLRWSGKYLVVLAVRSGSFCSGCAGTGGSATRSRDTAAAPGLGTVCLLMPWWEQWIQAGCTWDCSTELVLWSLQNLAQKETFLFIYYMYSTDGMQE